MTEPVKASEHTVPEGVSDQTIEGVGKLSEGFEYIERAKGHLYSFHQLLGRADFLVEEAAERLRVAGHEEFDDTYYEFFRGLERESRQLTGGVRHLHEARMKEQRRTPGRPAHDADPE